MMLDKQSMIILGLIWSALGVTWTALRPECGGGACALTAGLVLYGIGMCIEKD